jgi:hypothetical protein
MRWNEELDKKLKTLITNGKDYNEIIKELNISYRCVSNRAFRLGLKVIKPHREDILCKNCGEIINKTISDEKQFCNSSCAAHYNNKGRKHSEETKEKIRKSLVKNTIHVSIIKEKTKKKPKITRICKNCKKEKVMGKHKSICDDCRIDYYHVYRPSCEFDFNLSDYSNEFDFDLIKEHGWYSPTNKKNNLNGVSRDHLYSVKDGYLHKVDPNIIKHPANCRLMKHQENNVKNVYSIITLEELQIRISQWNNKYSFIAPMFG